MAKDREARLRAQKKYDDAHKDNYKAYYFKCHKETDKDIIDYLESVDKKQTVVKEALRQYMTRNMTR